ncbi:TlpA disulfide reductase family protein [Thermonema rossianum]|uniref:TlpA disulfide reductase family protein n=1 Tax=Thermonema rossianum TaxID=55505 RepID=UPI0006920AAE|nr:TlpA disulfide reductase family protein [Thermonema rossianum]
MKRWLWLCLLAIGLGLHTQAQSVEVIKIDRLEKEIARREGVVVVNFWATWCAPCVKELPDLYRVYQDFQARGVQLLLVSLDFADEQPKALALLKKKGIALPTFLLDETDYNAWIDRIEPRWQGAIPMTLIYRNGQKVAFIPGPVSYASLVTRIQEQLNP